MRNYKNLLKVRYCKPKNQALKLMILICTRPINPTSVISSNGQRKVVSEPYLLRSALVKHKYSWSFYDSR
jgi:hypothetical protein